MLRGQTSTLALGSTTFCRRVEFERALIAERIKAGMVRAKAQGKHVGRPRIRPGPSAERVHPGLDGDPISVLDRRVVGDDQARAIGRRREGEDTDDRQVLSW